MTVLPLSTERGKDVPCLRCDDVLTAEETGT